MFIEIVELIQSITPITFLFSGVLYLLIFIINNITSTDIEIKLMKPKNRFLHPFSVNALVSFLYSGLIIIISIDEFTESYNVGLQNTTISFFMYLGITWLLLSIFIITVISLFLGVIKVLRFIFGINYDFVINKEWKVIRVNSDNKIVVKNGNEIKFLDDPYNQEYSIILSSAKWKLESYEDEEVLKHFYRGSWLVAVFILILIFISLCLQHHFEFLILVIVLIFQIFINVIVWDSKISYEKFNEINNAE